MFSDHSIPPLHEHVLEEIFSVICDASYSTMQSLLLTNRLFHHLARPLLYRYIGLNLETDSFMREIQSWLTEPQKSAIPKAIRHISISKKFYGLSGWGAHLIQHQSYRPVRVIGGAPLKASSGDPLQALKANLAKLRAAAPSRPRDNGAEWLTIAALISQTTQLRSVTFACDEVIPLALLRAIHKYPTTIHLNIASWTRLSEDLSYNDPTELELLGSPSLRSLQAHILDPERSNKDLRLPALWRLVRSSPNLQSLMLHINRVGCVYKSYNPDEIQEWMTLASDFERTTVPQALPSKIRSLRIIGGDLSDSGLTSKELLHLTTLDCSKNLALWIIPSLTSLTHLTLRGSYNDKPIDELLIACPPLLSFSVTGWRKFLQLDTIFTQHGPSLRALALHEFENSNSSDPRQVLSAEELFRIRDGCPHLEQLSIDLNFPEDPLPESNHLITDIHEEIYHALCTLPSLRRLQLNFNLGISTYSKQRINQPRTSLPLVDGMFVKKVWAAVNRGRSALPDIQELRVAQGESQRATGYGRSVRWVTWEQHTHRWFKATRSERDDERDKIIISSYKDIPDFTEDVWREYRW